MTKEEAASKILDLTSFVMNGARYGHDTDVGRDDEMTAEAASIIQQYAEQVLYEALTPAYHQTANRFTDVREW